MKFAELTRILPGQCQIHGRKPIVLGFSGGPDSLSLFHFLKQEGLQVVVAHLDHSLRLESVQEAISAEAVAKGVDAPFFSKRADVAGYARKESLSIEEAARKLRYEFLFQVAAEQGAQAVAVAHNADDQVETLLMHLLRGAGSQGLSGMPIRSLPNPWSDTMPLIRPLLSIWREEIDAYCAENNLSPVLDPSNQDPAYFRNRLRHQLLPHLEKFSPGIKRRLFQTADLVSADRALVEELGSSAWRLCLAKLGKGYVRLSLASVQNQPLAIQRLLIRKAAETLRPGLRDLNFAAVQRALDMLSSPEVDQQDWIDGLSMLIEGDQLWIADWAAELPNEWPQAPENATHIESSDRIDLNPNWQLELDEGNRSPKDEFSGNSFQAWLDQERVGDELILRRRRAGDRFQPLGMHRGTMKLADYMINEKMPKRAREGWPLLCKGDEIVWVPGYQLAHPYRLRRTSRQALRLRLLRSKGI